MTIIDEYINYTRKYVSIYGSDVVVLMAVGSFYELYNASCDSDSASSEGANMNRISDLLNIQVTRKNKSVPEISRANPYMSGFPTHTLDRFLPTLLNDNLTVIIVDQITPPPNPLREVTHVYSKATYIPSEEGGAVGGLGIGQGTITNSVMAVYAMDKGIGAAAIDLTTGTVTLMENNDSTHSNDSNDELNEVIKSIEWMFQEVRPCELIWIGNHPLASASSAVLGNNIHVFDYGKDYDHDIHKLAFQNAILSQCYDIPQHISLSPIEYLDLERNIFALVAFTQLLVYCTQHNERATRILKKPTFTNSRSSQYITFSHNCFYQLDMDHVLPLLNRCVTSLGRRYFNKRIVHPFISKETMMDSWNKIGQWIESSNKNNISCVRKALGQVYDLERLFRKLAIHTIKTNELCMIKKSLNALTTLTTSCDASAAETLINDPNLNILVSNFDKLDIESSKLVGYCDKVDSISASLVILSGELSEVCDKVNKENKVDYFKIEKNDKDGYFFQITPKRYKDLTSNNSFKKIATSGVSFVRLSHSHLEALFAKEQILEKDLKEATFIAFERFVNDITSTLTITQLDTIVENVKALDFHTTCALNAIEYRYVMPTISGSDSIDSIGSLDSSLLEISGLRHPYIERKFQHVSYVENDLTLGNNNNSTSESESDKECEHSHGMLLYGLNAAGKSSLMKAVGLAVIMAQSGMYVAASAFNFTPFTQLFCRISKGDCIQEGKSTFIVEMSELRSILKEAGPRSLVLGDELCAGTEFSSALAIVAASINRLVNLKSIFIITTHLHELTAIITDESFKRIKTMHLDVFFDRSENSSGKSGISKKFGQLVYNRKLMPGQGSSMYGLEVAFSLDMDVEFLQDARDIRDSLGTKVALVSASTSGKKGVVKSRYNSDVFASPICGECKRRPGQDFHHILEQHLADGSGYIKNTHIHKNRASNLIYLCKICHDKQHAK